jgi:hypothetical protein
METLITSLVLVIVGFVAAFGGYMLFRLLLPLMGFIVGFIVGFSGVQAVFGSNVWSYSAALVTALIVGLIFALVSYMYYTVGVMVVIGSIVAAAFAFFGTAVGLSEEGFIVFLLSLTGAIAGGVFVLRTGLHHSLIVSGSALFGVAAMLTGAYLLFGDLSLADLHGDGILRTMAETVSSSWLWLFVLIGGTVFATAVQHSLIARAIIDSPYMYEEPKKPRTRS